jgi:hypothetical protein
LEKFGLSSPAQFRSDQKWFKPNSIKFDLYPWNRYAISARIRCTSVITNVFWSNVLLSKHLKKTHTLLNIQEMLSWHILSHSTAFLRLKICVKKLQTLYSQQSQHSVIASHGKNRTEPTASPIRTGQLTFIPGPPSSTELGTKSGRSRK